MSKKRTKLSDKNILFSYYYVFGYNNKGKKPVDVAKMNPYQAALAAGYSESYARKRNNEIVDKCRDFINELLQPVKDKLIENAEDLFKAFQNVLGSSAADFFEWLPVLDDKNNPVLDALGLPVEVMKMKRLDRLPRELQLIIEGIEFDRDGQPKLKLISKSKIMEMMGRHFKMFTDNLNVTGEVTQNVVRLPSKKAEGEAVDNKNVN